MKRIICAILSVLIIATTMSFSRISAANVDYLNWKQFDPAWGEQLLGSSLLPMKNSGCLVTSMAIALYDLGYTENEAFDPGKLLQKLNQNDGITAEGYFRWGSISRVIPGASEQIIQGNAITAIMENMTLTKRVIINVNKGGHWTFLKSVSQDGTVLEVADVGSNKITSYPVSEVSRFMVISYNRGFVNTPETGTGTGMIIVPTQSVAPTLSVTPTLPPTPVLSVTPTPTPNEVVLIPTVTPEPIQSKSIVLNLTTLYLKTTQGYQLKATVKPWNAMDKRVLWKSGNEQIVTVNKTGVVVAKKRGTAYVYAQSLDGKSMAKCKVIIKK